MMSQKAAPDMDNENSHKIPIADIEWELSSNRYELYLRKKPAAGAFVAADHAERRVRDHPAQSLLKVATVIAFQSRWYPRCRRGHCHRCQPKPPRHLSVPRSAIQAFRS